MIDDWVSSTLVTKLGERGADPVFGVGGRSAPLGSECHPAAYLVIGDRVFGSLVIGCWVYWPWVVSDAIISTLVNGGC